MYTNSQCVLVCPQASHSCKGILEFGVDIILVGFPQHHIANLQPEVDKLRF
jgi:hypothetical protein